MPITVRLNGRVVTLDDSDITRLQRGLVQATRQYVWLMPRLRFDGHYRNWAYHNRGHSFNVMLLVVEAVGGATLPNARVAAMLKRRRDMMDRMMNPRGMRNFYALYPAWIRGSSRFCRQMSQYMDNMMVGTAQTVRALEITRDASFVTLNVCANILSMGSASAFTVAGSAAAGALVRGAAIAYVTRALENASTRLGRTLAGNPPTAQESATEAVNAAVNAVPDSAMGAIIGAIMGPLTQNVSNAAAREIARGNIADGVLMEVAIDRLNGTIGQIIDNFIQRHPADIRALLRNAGTSRNNAQTAQIVADGLMRNRQFRRDLDTRLQRDR